jgi:hypothetical protein
MSEPSLGIPESLDPAAGDRIPPIDDGLPQTQPIDVVTVT